MTDKHKEALEALQTQIHQHIELRLEHGYVTANTPEIEAAISALQALQAASWQPIETYKIEPFNAEKWYISGDRVLGMTAQLHGYHPVIMNYSYTKTGKGRWRDALGNVYKPTHWQPLPAAPVDGGE